MAIQFRLRGGDRKGFLTKAEVGVIHARAKELVVSLEALEMYKEAHGGEWYVEATFDCEGVAVLEVVELIKGFDFHFWSLRTVSSWRRLL